MKLLIVTQVIDVNHPILGFFHRWVEEFAKHAEKVTVICQAEGKHVLPDNVTVLSLGKELGNSKFKQLANFYRYTWRERQNYDSVFVHMIPLYVILGGPLWRLLRKKIGLWYTHGTVSFSLKIATQISNYVFTASPESFNINTKKKIVTGHGININCLGTSKEGRDLDLITVGRISKSKNLHTLIKAMAPALKSKDIKLNIVGATTSDLDKEYKKTLEAKAKELEVEDRVVFHGPVTYDELPAFRNRAKVFVTAAQNGSLDKVMLEAMASGLPVVSMAPGSHSLPLGSDQVSNPNDLTTAVLRVLNSGNYERPDYTQHIKEKHSLPLLVTNITNFLKP